MRHPPRDLLPFLSRTNLCSFQSTKNLPSRRQELKAPRRISGYAPITSLRISFGTPSIPGAGPRRDFGPVFGTALLVETSYAQCT